MNNFDDNKNPEFKENVVAGIVGAFLFSLVGAVVYFLLNLIGYVASISGLIGAVCAVKGYSVFSKKESKKGIIISAIISLLVIVIAWYFCLAYDIYDAYKFFLEEGDVDYHVSFVDALSGAHLFLEDPEIAPTYFKNLALGVIFSLLGSGSFVINKLRNANKKSVITPEVQTNEVIEDQTVENTEDQMKTDQEESHVDH